MLKSDPIIFRTVRLFTVLYTRSLVMIENQEIVYFIVTHFLRPSITVHLSLAVFFLVGLIQRVNKVCIIMWAPTLS